MKPAREPRQHKLLAQALELIQITPQARTQAAGVLEVLAGLRTPEQAAAALSISLPTYYNLETRALRGLLHGCMPQPPGRTMALAAKLRLAESRCAELEKQVQRYQALLRTAQRNIGLPPVTAAVKTVGKRTRRCKPRVRALRAVAALRQGETATDDSSSEPLSSGAALGS